MEKVMTASIEEIIETLEWDYNHSWKQASADFYAFVENLERYCIYIPESKTDQILMMEIKKHLDILIDDRINVILLNVEDLAKEIKLRIDSDSPVLREGLIEDCMKAMDRLGFDPNDIMFHPKEKDLLELSTFLVYQSFVHLNYVSMLSELLDILLRFPELSFLTEVDDWRKNHRDEKEDISWFDSLSSFLERKYMPNRIKVDWERGEDLFQFISSKGAKSEEYTYYIYALRKIGVLDWEGPGTKAHLHQFAIERLGYTSSDSYFRRHFTTKLGRMMDENLVQAKVLELLDYQKDNSSGTGSELD